MKSRALTHEFLASVKLRYPLAPDVPAVISDLIESTSLIVTERERFPELGNGKSQQRVLFGKPDRERHLWRLRSHALVLSAVFKFMDIISKRSGKTLRDGTCDAIRVIRARRHRDRDWRPHREAQNSIERETGLSHTTVSAALADLVDAGYLSRHPRHEDYEPKDDPGVTRWRSYPTIYVVTPLCFARLGMELQVAIETKKAVDRGKERPAPLDDMRVRRLKRKEIRLVQRLAAKRSIQAAGALSDSDLQRRRNEIARQLAEWSARQHE